MVVLRVALAISCLFSSRLLADEYYIVQPGDTFSYISAVHLKENIRANDRNTYEVLKRLNPELTDRKQLYVGQRIRVKASKKFRTAKVQKLYDSRLKQREGYHDFLYWSRFSLFAGPFYSTQIGTDRVNSSKGELVSKINYLVGGEWEYYWIKEFSTRVFFDFTDYRLNSGDSAQTLQNQNVYGFNGGLALKYIPHPVFSAAFNVSVGESLFYTRTGPLSIRAKEAIVPRYELELGLRFVKAGDWIFFILGSGAIIGQGINDGLGVKGRFGYRPTLRMIYAINRKNALAADIFFEHNFTKSTAVDQEERVLGLLLGWRFDP